MPDQRLSLFAIGLMESNTSTPLKSALSALKGLGANADRAERTAPRAPAPPPAALSAPKTSGGYALTEEQEAAWACESQRVKVRAYAGSGKTSLLLAIAQKRQVKGLYIAFNKSIATEARQKFPDHIQCKTSHSIALSSLRQQDARWREIAADKIGPCATLRAASALEARLSEAERKGPLVKLALETVQRFITSGETRISEAHLPAGSLRMANAGKDLADAEKALSLAQDLWRDMGSPLAGTAPISHDGYLKKWSLSSRPISADLLLLDEAQDSNAPLLNALAQTECRQVYVGDEHQAIYGFRGAQNALDSIMGASFHLTQSFRFGAALASLASSIILLKGGERPLMGMGSSTVIQKGSGPLGAKSLYLARSNAGLFHKALQSANAGRSLAFVGGGGVTLAGVDDLLALRRGERPQDPYWQGFSSLEGLQSMAAETMDMELLLKCALVEEYGDKLPAALRKISSKTVADPQKAHLLLSTVHKAKGMEFDWVELADDFALPEIRASRAKWIEPDDFEEANILYVAITRARRGLALRDESQWRWFERMDRLMRSPESAAAPDDIKAAAQSFAILGATRRGNASESGSGAKRL